MKSKTRKALDRLTNAIAHRAQMTGEAQWTNGYRCGYGYEGPWAERLYRREQRYWKCVGDAEANVVKALRVYARAIRAEVPS